MLALPVGSGPRRQRTGGQFLTKKGARVDERLKEKETILADLPETPEFPDDSSAKGKQKQSASNIGGRLRNGGKRKVGAEIGCIGARGCSRVLKGTAKHEPILDKIDPRRSGESWSSPRKYQRIVPRQIQSPDCVLSRREFRGGDAFISELVDQ